MSPMLDFLDSSPTIEEVERKIQFLRSDIQPLGNDIRTLERYRNAQLILISRLPPEILSVIFEYIALSRYAAPFLSDGKHLYQPWLSVSQVCNHWRTVALASPRMWGYILNHTRVEFADLFLKRSKDAPLYLRQFHVNPNDATIKRIFQHSDRLKEIDLWTRSREHFNLITNMRSSILESLSFSAYFNGARRARFNPVVEPGTVPSLHYLSLSKCIFDLDVPFFSHLSTLKLNAAPSSESLSVNDVLRALQYMAYLEVMELIGVVDGPDQIPNEVRVHHPRLREVLVGSCGWQGLLLFTHLSCPSIRSVFAHTSDHMRPSDLVPIASAIYSMIPTLPNRWKIHASIYPSIVKCGGTMQIWPDSDSVSEGPDAPFLISVSGAPTLETHQMLASLLPTDTTLEVLDFRYDHHTEELHMDELRAYLRSMGGVRELHVRDVEDIILVLADTPAPTSQQQHLLPSFSLPSLKSIVIGDPLSMNREREKLEKFIQGLTARKTVNAGIESLEIRCPACVVNKSDRQRLERLVGTLDFW